MTEKVVSFPGAEPLPENPLQIEPRRPSYCRHDRIALDTHSRTVRCTDCQQVLDPFDFLQTNAHTVQQAWSHYRQVMAKVAEKNESVEALGKEEKRLKARVKALKDKVEPGIDIRGKYL